MQTTSTLSKYLSLVKFSHTVFAMPFALIGFFLAVSTTPAELEWTLLLKVVLCMVLARNAAMAFNRYIDRDIDSGNPRTAIREIPSGMVKANAALAFVVVNAVAFVAVTWFINPLCFYLSPVALAVVLGYSLTKRFTALCHLVLGIGLGLAPIGAYLAVTGKFACCRWCSASRCCYGCRASTSSMPCRTRSLTAPKGCSPSLCGWARRVR
jgi:4-hydroxybenzoate polyprenyltransferase